PARPASAAGLVAEVFSEFQPPSFEVGGLGFCGSHLGGECRKPLVVALVVRGHALVNTRQLLGEPLQSALDGGPLLLRSTLVGAGQGSRYAAGGGYSTSGGVHR